MNDSEKLKELAKHLKNIASVDTTVKPMTYFTNSKGELISLITTDRENKEEKTTELKDFFNKDFDVNKIQEIKKEFGSIKPGKQMAHLIYILNIELNLITYYLNNTKQSRKHFIQALTGNEKIRTSGVDAFFDTNNGTLKDKFYTKDSDYTTIKSRLNTIIGVK